MTQGVESRIISHIDSSDTGCLIVGNDMRATLVGVRMESDYTITQLKSALASLCQKGELTHCRTDYGAREYRLTDRGKRHAEKLREKVKKVPLWV